MAPVRTERPPGDLCRPRQSRRGILCLHVRQSGPDSRARRLRTFLHQPLRPPRLTLAAQGVGIYGGVGNFRQGRPRGRLVGVRAGCLTPRGTGLFGRRGQGGRPHAAGCRTALRDRGTDVRILPGGLPGQRACRRTIDRRGTLRAEHGGILRPAAEDEPGTGNHADGQQPHDPLPELFQHGGKPRARPGVPEPAEKRELDRGRRIPGKPDASGAPDGQVIRRRKSSGGHRPAGADATGDMPCAMRQRCSKRSSPAPTVRSCGACPPPTCASGTTATSCR